MATLRQTFNRNVVLSYLAPDPLVSTPLMQSGAFISDARLRPLLNSGSSTFTVPSIVGIDTNLESNYGNTIFTDIAMPRGITAKSMGGRIAYLNEGFLESTLERFLTGVSPNQVIAGQIDSLWQAQAELRALATVIGLRNYDQANGKLLATDISKATATAASGFSIDAFIDAEATMAPGARGKGSIFVHPLIAAKMRKQQLLEQVTTSDDLPPITVYNGRAVIETDQHTRIGTGANAQYVTYLMNNGAFSADSVPGPEDLELERTASTGNGSGHTTLWTRRNMLIHPQGFSFIADPATLTGGTKNEALSASWSDLTNADNWAQVEGNPLSAPFRFLITNL